MARLIQSTDTLDVVNPPILIYGQPFSGKTSLAQTAEKPLTLDFDGGIQRSGFRKTTLGGEKPGTALSWAECLEEEQAGTFKPFRSLVCDTTGHQLESLINRIVTESPKNGSLDRGPNQSGWGLVKNRFSSWVKRQRANGYQVIFLCHEKEEKENETRYVRPSIIGGSYAIVMELCDIVGRLSFRGEKRVLDFSPTENHFGKNPAHWAPLEVPDLAQRPSLLADLIAEAARFMSTTAEASAAVAKVVGEWQARLDADPTVDELNSWLPDIGQLTGAAKKQCWHLCKEFAARAGLAFDPNFKRFVKAVAA